MENELVDEENKLPKVVFKKYSFKNKANSFLSQ